jgi:hypothetical protein
MVAQQLDAAATKNLFGDALWSRGWAYRKLTGRGEEAFTFLLPPVY